MLTFRPAQSRVSGAGCSFEPIHESGRRLLRDFGVPGEVAEPRPIGSDPRSDTRLCHRDVVEAGPLPPTFAWSVGEGREIRGPIDALLLLLAGRLAELHRLGGDGTERLRRRSLPI